MSDRFSISAIPHTVRETVLAERRKGDTVNLENDVIGKYVEKFMKPAVTDADSPSCVSGITEEFLTRYGF